MNQSNKYCIFCMEPISENDKLCSHCGREQQIANVLPHHLLPGTVLSGKFLVGAVLGEGGFGITYIGRDVNLDMRIAIKEYYQSGFVNRNNSHSKNIIANTGEPEAIFEKGKDRFLKEARILASFSSEPGIVGVRDFFNENNTAYIIMDYLDGITLKDYLKQNGNMSMPQVLELMKPVMSVLTGIHEQGLIHRDISPDNIMLMKNGSLKLLDFGAARNVTGLDDKSLTITLKPGYAPEEQYRSKGKQGPWTDVYALSATLYKCITGITPEDAMQRVFGEELKSPSALGAVITPEQETVLLKGMAILQKNRFQDIGELWEAFFGTNIQEKTNTTAAAVSNSDNTVSAGTDEEKNETMMAEEANETVMAADEYIAEQSAPDPPPEVNQISKSKTDFRKNNNSVKIWIGLGALLLIFIVWGVFGSMNNVKIGDKVVKNTDETVAFSEAPAKSDLEKLKDMPNLRQLSLNYSEGLDDETLQIVRQLTSLKTLYLGDRYYSASSLNDTPALDLSFIKDLKKLEELNIRCLAVEDFSALKELPALTVLSVYKSTDDISTMTGLTKVIVLNLAENNISDLSSLKDCTEMTSLDVSYNQLKNLDGLEGCLSLSSINAAGNQLNDISAIQNCKEIIAFWAAENQLTDVSVLGEFQRLSILDIRQNSITDISALSNCKKLKEIQADENQITDLPVLSASKETLKYLSIGKNKLTNLDALSENIYLENIIAPNNEIVSIDGLTNCTQLLEVNLNNNQIPDITVLGKSAKKLESIQLVNNSISDISSLKGTVALILLALDGNTISDLTPLKESVMVQYLFLHDNQLTSIQALSALTQLKYLDVSDNQIVSIDALAKLNPAEESGLDICLDLSGNQISDISPLPKLDFDYAALYLDGNPIKGYSRIKDLKFTLLTFTYQDGIDYTPLKEAKSDRNKVFYAVDTPLDKQVNLDEELKDTLPVNFVTAEEISEYKQTKRYELTGVNNTGENTDSQTSEEEQ